MRSAPVLDLDEVRQQFTIVAFSWSFAVLISMTAERMAETHLQVIVCVFSVFSMVFPSSIRGLLAVCGAYLVHLAVDAYRVPFVHTMFLGFGCTAILTGMVCSLTSDDDAWKQRFLKVTAGPAVALALIGFLFAGLAKLNTDFLTPTHSCGSIFYDWQRTILPFRWILPCGDPGYLLGIYGTLALELLAPLLWLHPRTRGVGFLLSLSLVVLLSSNPIPGRVYAFAFPFAALMAFAWTWPRMPEIPRWTVTVARIGLVAAAGYMIVALDLQPAWNQRHGWVRGAVLLALVTMGCAFPWALRGPPLWGPGWRRGFGVWLVPLVLVMHEARPYFGFRPYQNFTMAASFRITETYSNHYLVRAPLWLRGLDQVGEWWGWAQSRGGDLPVVCHKNKPEETNQELDRRVEVARAAWLRARAAAVAPTPL